MPDTVELQNHFGQSGQQRHGCGFPQAHLLAMFDAATFATLPETILVRELRYRTRVAGFRTREIILVTTLLDAERYPLAELAKLYHRRWEIEASERPPTTDVRINRLRPHRCEPRVRKRRPKEFPLMKSPRRQLREQLLAKRVRA